VAKKMGFNEYKIIDEDISEFYITNKEDKKYTVIVDTKILDKLISLNYRWHYLENKDGMIYIISTLYFKSKCNKTSHKSICLHDVIMGLDSGDRKIHVDHENHNNLDNREKNLRVCSSGENSKNRLGKNSNNTTGHRNVCFYNGWYLVQLQIDGRNKLLGKFKDVEEAGDFAKEMRKKYYKEYSGDN
jgi:hypothetical protein